MLKMQTVIFILPAIFDGKVRKPGTTLTVSESEAENLRRVGVIAEKDTDKIKPETNNEHNNEHHNDSDNVDFETKPDYHRMNKKDLIAELIKRGIQVDKESKSKMRRMINDFDNKQLSVNE